MGIRLPDFVSVSSRVSENWWSQMLFIARFVPTQSASTTSQNADKSPYVPSPVRGNGRKQTATGPHQRGPLLMPGLSRLPFPLCPDERFVYFNWLRSGEVLSQMAVLHR